MAVLAGFRGEVGCLIGGWRFWLVSGVGLGDLGGFRGGLGFVGCGKSFVDQWFVLGPWSLENKMTGRLNFGLRKCFKIKQLTVSEALLSRRKMPVIDFAGPDFCRCARKCLICLRKRAMS